MALIDTNLACEQLNAVLERDGDTASIKWGYNSGGYEHFTYFVTKDGGALFIDTVIAEINNVDFTDESDPQWLIIGHEVNYEDTSLVDAHTGKPIPTAYS